MGGNITVTSEFGKGSRFEFNVFLTKGIGKEFSAEDLRPEPTDDICFAGKRILLVEDIEINRIIVQSLLENTHVGVDCAENGLEAAEMFLQNQDKYDLIFMDVQIPVMGGFDATRKIRAVGSAQTKSVPIIAMTANAFKEDVDKCRTAGMDDRIAKPIETDILLAKMCKYLRGIP